MRSNRKAKAKAKVVDCGLRANLASNLMAAAVEEPLERQEKVGREIDSAILLARMSSSTKARSYLLRTYHPWIHAARKSHLDLFTREAEIATSALQESLGPPRALRSENRAQASSIVTSWAHPRLARSFSCLPSLLKPAEDIGAEIKSSSIFNILLNPRTGSCAIAGAHVPALSRIEFLFVPECLMQLHVALLSYMSQVSLREEAIVTNTLQP